MLLCWLDLCSVTLASQSESIFTRRTLALAIGSTRQNTIDETNGLLGRANASRVDSSPTGVSSSERRVEHTTAQRSRRAERPKHAAVDNSTTHSG